MDDVLTERLLLRRWRPEDGADWRALCAVDDFWFYPFRRGLTEAEADAMFDKVIAHWDREGYGLWAVEERASGRLIGELGLAIPTFLPEVLPAVEIGWRLEAAARGKGFAAEGATEALRYGFEDLELERIICIVEPENTSSIQLAERLGFEPERETISPDHGSSLTVLELPAERWRATS